MLDKQQFERITQERARPEEVSQFKAHRPRNGVFTDIMLFAKAQHVDHISGFVISADAPPD